MATALVRVVVKRTVGGRVKRALRQAWAAAGTTVWGRADSAGRPDDALDGGMVGWADRGRAERRRCVGWDGRIEEKWVAPLRCVVRAGGCEGVGGASGSRSGQCAGGGSSCGASAGSGGMERDVVSERLGEVIEASGMGRAQYRSGSRWHRGQRGAMRAWLWARGVGVPFGDG